MMGVNNIKSKLLSVLAVLGITVLGIGFFGRSVSASSVPLIYDPVGTAEAANNIGDPSFAGMGGDTVSDHINVFSLDLSNIGNGTCSISDIASVSLVANYTRDEPQGGGIANDDGGALTVGNPADLTAWGTISSPLGSPSNSVMLAEWALRDFITFGGQVSTSGVPIGGTWSSATPPTVLKVMVLALVGGEQGESTGISQPTADVTLSSSSPCISTILSTAPETPSTSTPNTPTLPKTGDNQTQLLTLATVLYLMGFMSVVSLRVKDD